MLEWMRGWFATFAFIFAAAAAFAGGSALSARAPSKGPCHVIGGDKLPPAVRQDVICTEIARAMTQRAAAVKYSVEVKILSPSRLSAVLVANGRTLPDQNFAVSDRELNSGAIRRFAESLAGEAAKAMKE
jgi:hypothetical protein